MPGTGLGKLWGTGWGDRDDDSAEVSTVAFPGVMWVVLTQLRHQRRLQEGGES